MMSIQRIAQIYLLAALLIACLCAGALAQTNQVPTNMPDSVEVQAALLVAGVLPAAEWELTFEWVPKLGSTNVTTYPIKVQVPFEHDGGLIYIRARKVYPVSDKRVNLPMEMVALPQVSGPHYIYVWAPDLNRFIVARLPYENQGVFPFYMLAWNQWYWVGLWSETEGRYVFGRWVGQFLEKTTTPAVVPSIPEKKE